MNKKNKATKGSTHPDEVFANLEALAKDLRKKLKKERSLLLYAYNGTGKTRLSMAFKELGKQSDQGDTLYFNAFTEDLFTWDNDLDGDSERVLKMNSSSKFFSGIEKLEMESRIRHFLHRYVDFDFIIDYERWVISFNRNVEDKRHEGIMSSNICNIKVSRGEESIFIWCFFLAIVQLTIDEEEAYKWVKYLFIDDPVSSLDENNAIALAHNLAQLITKKGENKLKIVIATHHTLFFNVLFNELGIKTKKYFLSVNKENKYILQNTGDTPFFHHLAMLIELYQAEQSGEIYTYHFTMLRNILEKSASFHGFPNFSACIKKEENDPDGILHARLINILNHGNYSLYEPREMLEENKRYFRKILNDFKERYPFNNKLFPSTLEESG